MGDEAIEEAIREYHERLGYDLVDREYPTDVRRDFIAGAEWARKEALLVAEEPTYCPVHGNLLAAPRSYRCAEAPKGHEFGAAGVVSEEPTAAQLLEAIYDPEEDGENDSVRFGLVVQQYERLKREGDNHG